MLVSLRSVSSQAFDIKKDGKVIKRIVLKGNGELTEISNDDFNALKSAFDCIEQMIDEGFLLINETNTDKVKDDIKQDTLNTQETKKSKDIKKA